MTLYNPHEEQPGARGGVWHLHHKPGGKERTAVNVAPVVAIPAALVATEAWPLQALHYHVTGAIERGEKQAIEAVTTKATQADLF